MAGWALVLAGIEPAITSAMRAASDLALPSSSTDEVGDGRRKNVATTADQVRLEEQIMSVFFLSFCTCIPPREREAAAPGIQAQHAPDAGRPSVRHAANLGL